MAIRRPAADAVDRTSCPARGHGTPHFYYRGGCICPDAAEAARLYNCARARTSRPAMMVPMIGTTRRLRALAAIGYSHRQLQAECGASLGQLSEWRNGKRLTIHCDNASAVAAMYERLSGTPGRSKKSRAAAQRNGWTPPLLWDDGAIDDPGARPASGRRTEHSALQRKYVPTEEVEHFLFCGEDIEDIADHFGVSADSLRDSQKRRAREAERQRSQPEEKVA